MVEDQAKEHRRRTSVPTLKKIQPPTRTSQLKLRRYLPAYAHGVERYPGGADTPGVRRKASSVSSVQIGSPTVSLSFSPDGKSNI